MSTVKKQYDEIVKKELKKKFEYQNVHEIPKIAKVVINRGLGEAASNSKLIPQSVEQIQSITGQKPLVTKAKKSISNFKLRKGQPIGCKVTLRGKKMYEFLTKLIHIALPKIRDFRGVPTRSFDGRGSYTLGVKEEIIFPEIKLDKLDKIRGFNITIVTTAKTDDECRELLTLIGMPFRK